MRVALLATLAVATLVGASLAGAAADPWRMLYRPLHVPRLAPGKACPVSRVDASVPWRRFGIAPGIGRGPAYPVGLDETSTLVLAPAENFGSSEWAGQKVLWFVHPSYGGPVLVRGRRLDGEQLVRFERGDVPPDELRVRRGETVLWNGRRAGSRGRPSYTRLQAPGCYAYQIDGTGFSRIVVFRAVRAV